jgi:hypothetical protein
MLSSLKANIQRILFDEPVLQGFGDMFGPDAIGTSQVGDRARHPKHTVVTSSTQRQLFGRSPKE